MLFLCVSFCNQPSQMLWSPISLSHNVSFSNEASCLSSPLASTESSQSQSQSLPSLLPPLFFLHLLPLTATGFVNADGAECKFTIWMHPVLQVLASVSLPGLLWIDNICSMAKCKKKKKKKSSALVEAIWHTRLSSTRLSDAFLNVLAAFSCAFFILVSASFIFPPCFLKSFVCAVWFCPSVALQATSVQRAISPPGHERRRRRSKDKGQNLPWRKTMGASWSRLQQKAPAFDNQRVLKTPF